MRNFNEKEIVRQLSNEDTRYGAFEQIVNCFSRTLYWQIRHIVTDHNDADDILQNTFLKAWKSAASFRGESQLSTWLYKIAYNESINHLSQRHNTIPLNSLTEGIGEEQNLVHDVTSSDQELSIDGDRAQQLLTEAIATLPKKQRAVFSMKYFDDMKYEQISEITGTSVGALKASYHLAVGKITNYIQLNSL